MLWTWKKRDHPRVRGEKQQNISVTDTSSGSPPRTRGEVTELIGNLGFPRITPAYAGRRMYISSTASGSADHPRVRGEKAAPLAVAGLRLGSPPRTRGEADIPELGALEEGITPAYAGRSHGADRKPGISEDHPRVRGEKTQNTIISTNNQGSPPRTRGEVAGGSGGDHIRGITPAYAGRSRREYQEDV